MAPLQLPRPSLTHPADDADHLIKSRGQFKNLNNPLAIIRGSSQSAGMNERLQQLIRFCAVGVVCLLLGLAILAGLHELAGLNYLLAYVVGFVVTNIAGYLLNAHFTFSLKSTAAGGAFRYMVVNGTMLCLNALALKLLVDVLHVWYLAAATLLALVNAPVSFCGQWLFTYRSSIRNIPTAI